VLKVQGPQRRVLGSHADERRRRAVVRRSLRRLRVFVDVQIVSSHRAGTLAASVASHDVVYDSLLMAGVAS
jgi:phosphoribosylcarboxyaminoimidazole (NCAIR) mutase